MSLSLRQSKLSTLTCKYCNQRVTGDIDYRTYHFYINHPEKLREMMQDGWNLTYRRKYKTIDNAYNRFIKKMELVDKRERQLI